MINLSVLTEAVGRLADHAKETRVLREAHASAQQDVDALVAQIESVLSGIAAPATPPVSAGAAVDAFLATFK